jgi:hypothetical protein
MRPNSHEFDYGLRLEIPELVANLVLYPPQNLRQSRMLRGRLHLKNAADWVFDPALQRGPLTVQG